ncbi:MAG: ATP-binding protein [Cyanobacteria bacterium P01_F01_bin.33]
MATASTQSNVRKLLGETRTRVLLLYAVLIASIAAASIPLLFAAIVPHVERRVRNELRSDHQKFVNRYRAWKAGPDSQSISGLATFARDELDTLRFENDNFHIFLFDDKLAQSVPSQLPQIMQPGGELFALWLQEDLPVEGQFKSRDADLGTIFYAIEPLVANGQQQGVYIDAYISGPEIREALAGAYVFAAIEVTALLGAFVLAWIGSGRLLKPVRDLTAIAQKISESDLTRRLPIADSSELGALASTFNKMMDRLQNAFDSQCDFIKDAGHELRTPITIAMGHLDLMTHLDGEDRETINLAIGELQRMNRIVSELVLLAKFERPDFLKFQAFEIRTFMEEVYAKAQTLAERDWRLRISLDGSLLGDRQRLTGALINLLNNAAQHTEKHEGIELGATLHGQYVKIWVSDEGEGITPANCEKVFQRFARLSNQRRRSEGSGLGLAIVKATVEGHGGWIELDSQLGVGSTFLLVFPARLLNVAPAEISNSPSRNARRRSIPIPAARQLRP